MSEFIIDYLPVLAPLVLDFLTFLAFFSYEKSII